MVHQLENTDARCKEWSTLDSIFIDEGQTTQSINQSPLFQATRPIQTAGKKLSKWARRREQRREKDETERLYTEYGALT